MLASKHSYRLVRSNRRKTLALRISHQGLEVRAPSWVAAADIDQFVASRHNWIERHLASLASMPAPESLEKRYEVGELFQYRGKDYPLALKRGARSAVSLTPEALIVTLGSRIKSGSIEAVQRLIEDWYKREALTLLTERSFSMAHTLGRTPGNIRVRRTRSKWGHCTVKGDLQYNWLIMAAPDPVIDYLVAHEVSHLIHHNHSKAFWQQVSVLCPDWKTQRDWLKKNGYLLRV